MNSHLSILVRKVFTLVLLCLLVAYAYYDVTSNAQAGNMDVSRGTVYVIVIAITSFLFVYVLFYGSTSLFRLPIVKLLCLILFWIIVDNIINKTMGRPAYINILICLLWIMTYLSFFLATVAAHGRHRFTTFFILLFFLYCIINIYAQRNIAASRDQDYGMTSYSYYLLAFLPAIMMIKSKRLRSTVLLLCSLLVLFSMKRGPIIALPVMIFLYLFSKSRIGLSRIHFIKVLFYIIVFVGVFYLINLATNGFLIERFSSREISYASGRDEMWSLVWSQIKNSSFISLLFGNGSGASVALLGTGVHNEWLEFLYTFGAIGVLFYFVFFIGLINRYIRLINNRSIYAPQYGAAVSFFFLSGLSDGFFFVYWSFYFFAEIGYIEALTRYEDIDSNERFLSRAKVRRPSCERG